MAYYGGYSRGYAKAQEEYRKKEYETELEKAKDVYQVQTGLPWSEAEEQDFAHLWRLKLIKSPAKLSKRDPFEWIFLTISLLFSILAVVGIFINLSHPDRIQFPLIILFGSGFFGGDLLYGIIKDFRALQTIARIGEDAWREQVAKRQEENDIEPWNAEGNY